MSKSLAAVFGKNNVCSLAVFLSARWDDGLQPQPSTVDHSGSGTTVVSASRPIDSTLPILRPSDPPALVSLLLDTLVGVASLSTKLNQPIPEHRLPGYNRSQSELINRQIEHILQSRKSTKNVLALGYRQISGRSVGAMSSTMCLESYFPNTLTGTLKTLAWQILLERIGDFSMGYLLRETRTPVVDMDIYSARLNLPAFSIHESSKIALLEKPPDCPKDSTRDTILSSGESHLVSKKREFSSIDTHECHSIDNTVENAQPGSHKRARKRVSKKAATLSNSKSPIQPGTEISTKSSALISIRPSMIILPWSCIFYGRPSFTNRHTQRYGFPNSHILCLLERDPKVLLRELSRSIFPLQYHLTSPLTEAKVSGENWLKRRNYGGATIPTKRPRRIMALNSLLEKVILLCKKCNYHALLDHYCPLPQVRSVKKSINRMLDLSIEHQKVSLFIKSVLKHIIPKDLWGDDSNRDVILAVVSQLVSLRRYETLSLQNIITGIKMSKMKWLAYGTITRSHVSSCETEKQQQILYEFLYWLFADVVITLIKTNFYATDTAPYKNRVFYFRHEMWGRVGQYLQESARASLLEPIDMTDMANVLADAGGQRALGFSSIRFLPKEVGARTIMNLGRKPNVKEMEYIGLSPNQIKRLLCFRNKGANMLSINQLLQNAHHVLSFEKTHRPTLINNAVMGLNDIYLKFKAYKMGLVEAHIGGKIPQLYCCKMDIASCFDTIQHDKLLSILETFLSKTDYVIQKYATLYASGERVRRGFHKRARDAADFQKFSELVEESSAIVNHTVFTDQVEYQIEAANSIRDLLISHIKGNYVKIGKKFYRQKVGIPQGSILSTILCSLFYAHFENLYLADLLLNDSGTLLMRYVDDFFFISTSKLKAQQFMEIMHQPHPDYGCTANISKSLANFPIVLSGGRKIQLSDKDFPWCGVAIDLHRLEIKSVSFQSRSIFNIADSLTMDISRTPGQHLKEKLFHYLKAKFHPIYLDTSLNSVCGVLSNIYENFCSAAMRLCSYMRISFEGKIDRNLGFIIEIIEKAVCFGAQIMHSRMRSNPMLQNKCEFRVASKEIQSLGLKAFIFVLGRRKERFGQLLPPLRKLLVLIGISKPRERLHARIHAKSRRDAPKVVY
ncbi:hypothetical protein BASA50_004185 [Batrachochytrium salamandrivorans]|uniref:Telomerase reverse transcriptase n=1 Tax=Batrachochytrium salamandrivorans TaxID=1357716 RepID=A0ABQ8FJD5_9FUNG|nr:hypothetical protein BASA50_004185 [Batrachochytrium salamandrivorans]